VGGASAATRRGAAFEVLDVVDFGGACPTGAVPELGKGPANAGRLLLRRAEATKDRRKRWHEDKLDAAPSADSASSSTRALAVQLEHRQPAISAIVTRSMAASEARAKAMEGEEPSRRTVRALRGRH